MSSFRNYNDTRAYKARTNMGASSFGRNISSVSSLGSRNYDKDRLRPGRSSIDDLRSKSPGFSGRVSILEKYSTPGSNNSDMPYAMLDKYSRTSSRASSREPEMVTCYGSSTYPGSSLSRSYGSNGRTETKERSEPTVSYGSLRASSGRTSHEPSPEVSSTKTNSLRTYNTRVPSYGRSSASSSISEFSSDPVFSRCGSSTGRFSVAPRSSSERIPSALSYSGSERFRTSNKSLCAPYKDEGEVKNRTKVIKQARQELPDKNSRHSNKLKVNETDSKNKEEKNETVSLRVVTRGTSPTQPTSSSLLRSRRPDTCKVFKKEVSNFHKALDTKDEEMQVDRNEDARFSRLSGSSKISGAPWASYLDRYNSSNSPTGSSCSSRNYTTSGVLTLSRLNNYGNSGSNKSPNSSRSDDSGKTSSGSSREHQISGNNDHNNIKTKIKKSNETCNFNHCFTLKGSEKKECKSVSENSQDCETGESKSEESCQTDPSIPKSSPTSLKEEIKSCSTSSKSDTFSIKSYGRGERRGTAPKYDYSSSATYDENGVLKGQDKELRKDFQQRSESASSKSKSISRNNSSKNLPRQMTHTDSSEASVVNVPTGRLKSSSASSMTNHSAKIKAISPSAPSPGKYSSSSATSVSSRQVSSSDARGKPPVPKNEVGMKNTTIGMRYVNKDFRKSVLNMENGDPSRSQIEKKSQKKNQRSASASSQDFQSEPNSETVQQGNSSGSSTSLKSNRSNSRINKFSNSSKTGSKKHDLKQSDARVDDHNFRNTSNSPVLKKNSNSEGSCVSSSTDSSSSEEENDTNRQRSSSRRRRRTSKSPFLEGKNHMSTGSSRTSVLASSADELSLTMDKPPRPPASSRSKYDRNGKTEEAKSFLMKALAPVTSLFKAKQHESGEIRSDGWANSNGDNSESTKKSGHSFLPKSISQNQSKSLSSNISAKSVKKSKSNSRIRQQSSGDKPWWMDPNSDNVPEGVERNSVGNDDISQETTISTVLPDDGKFKFNVWRQDSEEKAWWLDPIDNIPEEETKNEITTASSMSGKESSRESTKSNSGDKLNRIRHQQSGERAWWMSDDPQNVPEGVVVIPVASSHTQSTANSETFNDQESFPRTISRIRHIESGERAWWMDSNSNVPEGITKISTETSNSNSDSSGSYDRIDIGVQQESEGREKRSLSKFPIEFPPPPSDEPLGDRASPEGVENPPDPPDNYGGRNSPYDNDMPMILPTKRYASRKRSSTIPLFIGSHTNIDDLLGGEMSPSHSTVMSHLRKQENTTHSLDDTSECEEIDANQVIIHDSTPKTPVIQRRSRDFDGHQPDGFIPGVEPVPKKFRKLWKGRNFQLLLRQKDSSLKKRLLHLREDRKKL